MRLIRYAAWVLLVVALSPGAAVGGHGHKESLSAVNQRLSDGTDYFRQRSYKKAADEFRQAIQISPQGHIPRLAYGHTLFALERYAESSRSLQDGLALFPGWTNTGFTILQHFPIAGEFEARMENLTVWVEQDPDNQDGLFLLGYLHYFSGAPDQAGVLFARLLRINPDHKAAKLFLPGV